MTSSDDSNLIWLSLIIAVIFFSVLLSIAKIRGNKFAKQRKFQTDETNLCKGSTLPPQSSITTSRDLMINSSEARSELVFFVEEERRFGLDDLLEAEADLKSQTLCSSLYKVSLDQKNGAVFAVKRLKKLQVSLEEFDGTMREIGNLKHPNLLFLVGYHSTMEEKLLIYLYQTNGSLLNLLEDYADGKREFSWKHRVSIALGIARGLNFIHENDLKTGALGNLKPSNILINENNEPQISEYGYTKFMNKKSICFMPTNGYVSPEKALSKQADVYSFGVILLELLTGKVVEKTGVDLPKWVKSMIREEWTAEVFDQRLGSTAGIYAFPLLNIALKCVAQFAENRPGMRELILRIEEIHDNKPVDPPYMSSEMFMDSYFEGDLPTELISK